MVLTPNYERNLGGNTEWNVLNEYALRNKKTKTTGKNYTNYPLVVDVNRFFYCQNGFINCISLQSKYDGILYM